MPTKQWIICRNLVCGIKNKDRPSLLYSQAVEAGIPDGCRESLIPFTSSKLPAVQKNSICFPLFRLADQNEIKAWFEVSALDEFHEYGLKEKFHPNNHGVCWSLQAAAFADLVDDQKMLQWVRQRIQDHLSCRDDGRKGWISCRSVLEALRIFSLHS